MKIVGDGAESKAAAGLDCAVPVGVPDAVASIDDDSEVDPESSPFLGFELSVNAGKPVTAGVGELVGTTVRSGTDCWGLATTAGLDTVGNGAKVDTGGKDVGVLDVAGVVGDDEVRRTVDAAVTAEVGVVVRTDDVKERVGVAVVIVDLAFCPRTDPRSSSLSDPLPLSLSSSSRRPRSCRARCFRRTESLRGSASVHVLRGDSFLDRTRRNLVPREPSSSVFSKTGAITSTIPRARRTLKPTSQFSTCLTPASW